ncbi:MAG TPA: NTPase [Thermodesulfobacteriota bacterium]|nr:NTPase [Thermodesulfobacteriota bacterium]
MSLKKNLLITGLPGVGKTTLIRKLHEALRDFDPVGFYTAEIRQEGMRKGFELVDLKGRRGVLSHIDFKDRNRVGRYKVDVGGFEDFLGRISFFDPSSAVIIIDEIGKMECLSNKFKRILEEVLDSEKWVIATVALKGSGLITGVKQRRDVKLFEMTKNNRDILLSEILKEIDPKETYQV